MTENGKNTVLMDACSAGHAGVVKVLVEGGARVDIDNIDRNTPLIVAAWKYVNKLLLFTVA